MGGSKDIWKHSGKSIGIEVVEGDKVMKEDTKQISDNLKNMEQRYDDQKLEFFSYSSGLKVGWEKISSGQADKIYHGDGPILIQFKETPERVKFNLFSFRILMINFIEFI